MFVAVSNHVVIPYARIMIITTGCTLMCFVYLSVLFVAWCPQ